jgi:hypothetical protein
MYGGKLATTGASGLAIGGLMVPQLWLLGVALTAVAAGAVLVRTGWRRGKSAGAR